MATKKRFSRRHAKKKSAGGGGGWGGGGSVRKKASSAPKNLTLPKPTAAPKASGSETKDEK